MEIQTLKTSYAGRRWHLFWLALKSSALTVLTLGIYRFWMKTRLRRYYWSAIRPGGVPLEYTGTGIEKLMGFLVAVVIMAFYIGVFNLILVFLSFSILSNNVAAYAMSFVGLIPIYFYAQYRARRYVLARTRWRGLRFGIDPAAWAYAWRAMFHWLATILTLGFLYPRQIYLLEKFRIDRTWLGRARFAQDGDWKILIPAAKHMYIGILLTVVAAALMWTNEPWAALFTLSLPYLIVGVLHLKVHSFRILAANKNLGESIRFQAAPRTWRVVWIYSLGNFLAGLILTGVMMVIIIGVVLTMLAFDPTIFDGGDVQFISSSAEPLVRYAAMVLIGLTYFSVFVFWGVLSQVFITLPLMRHYAETVTISNSHQLALIEQRPRDEFSEAEGFAEALDIGAAI
jgi:uncharacterized membrane protein YjgN (DUF898 family)